MKRSDLFLRRCVSAGNPACRAEVVGHAGPAAVGVQPAHEHRGPVCAPAGGLGGGEDGSLPPDLRAGNAVYAQNVPDRRAPSSDIKEPFFVFSRV